MFTNSGMMPFVPYFLGEEPVPYDPPRAVSIQKCVRAGGKHNDLDAIGRSPRHLSFFEMLGNFSFGDYFKVDAIPWAWEFITETLGIDGDRLWITCHTSDDEAEDIWADQVGVPRDRIQRLDADNFWEMGDTGPCGPSTEIFYDYGSEHGPDGGPANEAAEHRFVEIWNLVFTQYFRRPDGSLTDLPFKNVDTGAGLERILAVTANSPSLYAADVLSLLVDQAQEVTKHRLGQGELSDIALRLLADHTRTSAFLVADGVIPSNEDRGYVLRRVIRRAVRFAYMLDVDTLVLPPMVERCIEIMGDAYPELVAKQSAVLDMIEREENNFRRTLARGSGLLDAALDGIAGTEQATVGDAEQAAASGRVLDGDVAFELHDTYGFPLEVTQEMAELRGVQVDVAGFDAAMAEQRERSRAAGKKTGVDAGETADAERELLTSSGTTTFLGRELATVEATVVGIIGEGIFLDRTPFYAESGGQVGDTGTITVNGNELKVRDTVYALPGLHRHVIDGGEDALVAAGIAVGDTVTASIDEVRRAAIKRNHTGTHILHWALRKVLGDHVQQQGSWVGPDRLRFDFSHFEAVTDEQIAEIEDLAAEEILANHEVKHFETSMDEAKELGAIAFFGEKYGDRVRVLQAGNHSIELCGGTHVSALGDIGVIKIISESSIGSNIRRIEAITGTALLDRMREEEQQLHDVADQLGVAANDLHVGIAKRLSELKAARDEIKQLRKQLAGNQAEELYNTATNGVIVARVEADDRNGVRDLAVALRDKPGINTVVLGATPGGKGVALVAAVTEESGHNAGELLGPALKIVGGGGGKGADLAVAGGRDADRLDEALTTVRSGLLGN